MGSSRGGRDGRPRTGPAPAGADGYLAAPAALNAAPPPDVEPLDVEALDEERGGGAGLALGMADWMHA